MAKQETNLAYVRLIPMDEAAIQHWKSQQPGAKTKTLMANYDGGSFGQWGVSTPEDFLAEFECLRDSDFDIVLYAMARGPITLYPSKVGEFVMCALYLYILCFSWKRAQKRSFLRAL